MLQGHLEKLPHFVGVARAGSIRGYALKANLSQPAISKSIQILESVLECSLFVRAREGVQLTEGGQLLLEWAERTLNDSDQLEIQLRRRSQMQLEGNFHLGTYQSIAVYFIPHFFKFLRQTQKRLRLDLFTAPSAELVKRVKSGELDLIISIDPPATKGLTHRVMFDDTYSLYRGPREEHKLGRAPIFTLLPAKDANGRSLEAYLKASPWGKNAISCGDFEAAKAMLENGVGFALLPERVAKPLVDQRRAERVPEAKGLIEIGRHQVTLTYRSHREADLSIQWISRQIEQMMKRSF
jgi:DNA-binding transcriptional LysR family regulator